MENVKKLVSRRLYSKASGAHPDPDLLAALAENSVSTEDRKNVFEHLSACANCREAFYLALPETADSQQTISALRKQPGLALRWATLAASVIIIGTVLISNRGVFTEHSESREVASYPTPSAESSEAKTQATVNRPNEAAPSANETRARLRPPAKHMTAAPQASLQFDQSGEVHFAAAPARDAAPAAQSLAKAKQLDSSNLISSDSATTPLWRISSEGSPERSLDGARSWQAVSVRQGSPFHAITAVGSDVWVGGSAGVLYHSSDSGQTWNKVALSANGKAAESDIKEIRFSDPQNGLATTADGQVWITSDGGKNWQLK